MADRIIAQADLSGIWNCLRELGEYIDTTNSNVITVGKNVDALQQDLDAQGREAAAALLAMASRFGNEDLFLGGAGQLCRFGQV